MALSSFFGKWMYKFRTSFAGKTVTYLIASVLLSTNSQLCMALFFNYFFIKEM